MKFIDSAEIDVKSGRGGAGCVHFRREKFAPKMGPDGGDGGRGGHVYLVADNNLQSLLDFKFKSEFAAEDGQDGQGKDCNGHMGQDLLIKVPVGTVVRDAKTGQFLCDLMESGIKVMLLKGGRGGLGNMNFATATRQAPDYAQPGERGSERRLSFELKLLADVALVGFPNAGKSTLISRLSSAKPKIADYPFTTLVPNLGVVRGKRGDFVVADVPGIIEGASEGKGLGIQFLKHAERSRLLLILLDLDPHTGRQLDDEYRIIDDELKKFSRELSSKPRMIVVNKLDAFTSDANDPLLGEFLKERGFEGLSKILNRSGQNPSLKISAVSGLGLPELTASIESQLQILGPRVFVNEVSQFKKVGDARLFAMDAAAVKPLYAKSEDDSEIDSEDDDDYDDEGVEELSSDENDAE